MKPNLIPQEKGHRYLKFLTRSAKDEEWATKYIEKKRHDIDGYLQMLYIPTQDAMRELKFIKTAENDDFFKRMEKTRNQNLRRKQQKVRSRDIGARHEKLVLNAEVSKATKATLEAMKKEFNLSQGELLDAAVDILNQCRLRQAEMERSGDNNPIIDIKTLLEQIILRNSNTIHMSGPVY